MAIPKRQKRIAGRYAYVDGIHYKMPVDSRESSAIIAAFPIDWNAAHKIIPSGGDLYPYKLWRKGLLIVTVINYKKTDIGSYIEYSLAIACTRGTKPAVRFLPALFQKRSGIGQYVFDLPVSTEVSVKGGKGIWGMPKHQANLDYLEGKKWISAQYDLNGQMVSRFDVRRPRRAWLSINMPAANYCMFRGMIYKSLIYFGSKVGIHLFKPGSARLILGDHPRADLVRSLQPAENPLFAAYMPNVRGVLDDYFECWFVTSLADPQNPLGEGLKDVDHLGYGQDWLPPPQRDPKFSVDRE